MYWVTCGQHNYYPVVELEFAGTGELQEEQILIFDSGADANYINVDIVEPIVDDLNDYNYAIGDMRGVEVQFYLVEMSVVLKDGVRTIAGHSSFRAIVDWGRCPISGGCSERTCIEDPTDAWCGPRNGLMGPKLLVDLNASLTLHGGSESSEIGRN